MVKIELRNEARSRTLIQELLDVTFFNNEGQATHYVEFDTDAKYEILSRNLRIPGLEDIDRIRKLTLDAIHSMKTRDENGLGNFVSTVEKFAQEYLDLAQREFKILFVLNARENEVAQILPFEFLGAKIESSDWSKVSKAFEFQKWAEASYYGGITKKSELKSIAFVPLIATTYERDPNEAFHRANQVIHLFRALLNLVQDFGRRKFGRSPLAEFLPSPSYGIFDDRGTYLTLYYTTQKYEYTARSLSEQDLDRFRIIATRVREPTSNTDSMSLLMDALDKYGQAVDAIEWHEAFLWLWQILELVTLQTDNVRMDDVVARLKLIHKYDPLWSDLFEASREIRNKLVHRGQFSKSGMHEVNFLKVAVENLLFWLIDVTKSFPTQEHIRWFFSYAPRGDADLHKLHDESSNHEFKAFLRKLIDSRSHSQKGKKTN